ncbi:hypothetical protein [Mycobacterium sp. RTGN5]|uniref:hypothetical protein n=1 Tax=Mycobacterium sp. RTGN5 TaxID=3016522 RepID=UPI0029C8F316|nr:hypothetical protein [Mycobacterium sp. RTGN5]
MRMLAIGVALTAAAVTLAPPASAELWPGNYNFIIPDRRDFHTWVWAANPCPQQIVFSPTCVRVSANPAPIAKAYAWYGIATLANGQYTMTVDVPDGVRCGDIYYGPTIPTHDVYTWNATTLSGILQSSFDAGCDGAPGGTFTYPFWLTRL